MNASTIQEKITITIAPFNGRLDEFLNKVGERFGGNKDLIQVIRLTSFCYRISEPVTIRITTPRELGYERRIYSSIPKQMIRKKGLKICATSTPIRVALDFDQVRDQIPKEFLQQSWWIHMLFMDYPSSDGLIGIGHRRAIFTINPPKEIIEGVLDIECTNGWMRSSVEATQPMLFECL